MQRTIWNSGRHAVERTTTQRRHTVNGRHTLCRETRIIVGNLLCRHPDGEAFQDMRYGYPRPSHGRSATQ